MKAYLYFLWLELLLNHPNEEMTDASRECTIAYWCKRDTWKKTSEWPLESRLSFWCV